MRVCPLRYSKALSPYAQALRHVALRGAAALGPSAREMEIEMFRKGTLPADYRPPAHGKWDDTIERWAYAWQYPAEEDTRDEAQAVEKNAAAMQALLEFGERLISSPPSSDPNSGKHSSLYLDKMQRSQPLLPSGLMNDDYKDLEEAIESLQDSHVSHGASSVIPVVDFSRSTGIPMAYLDDGSERTNASKELGALLESSGLEYTEEGLIVVLTALARQHYYDVARAVFNFASGVGLGPSAEMYKALMKHSSSQGDVNHSMAIIEEMKEKGITPGIGNWHELMRSFHNARDYPAVSQIVDNMKMYANIEPNEVTFALQLRALGKDHTQLNSMAEAVQLFDQMENVYGYIASRSHYDAMMFALSQSPLPEMRLRCEELAQKMDLMGIVWNGTTYLNLIRSAQVVGDVTAVEKYLGKMRDDRIPMTIMHLTWAVHAHVQCIIRLDYGTLADKDDSNVMSTWLDHMNTCFGIYELVVTRGWEVQLPFVNALLRLCCQSAILSIEHLPSDGTAAGRFEEQASKLWNDTFDEWHLKKDIYSYECYIALLAHQQRIDEAEKLFQQLVMQEDLVPTRRTYECLIFMHLSSGEEGGAARALHYLEAMENARIHIRPALLKKMVRVHNAAGYKRDMKRRARRIMQAREEFLAKKTEGLGFPQDVSSQMQNSGEESQVPQPLPIHPRSTLAWWEEWKQSTISKHELFDEESSDGTPKGESFEEKNSALSLMGIQSQFPTISDVPQLDRHELLPKLRGEEGEVTGSLWALDGGELSYPKDGGGPQGWGVRLWRERALLKKEYQKVLDGKVAPAPFSELGKSVRVAGDQLDIEDSGATNPGELSDSRQFTDHRYENGSMKPPSEMAHSVDAAGELVWNSERRDALAPYKTDEELALEADNTFYAQMEATSNEKVKEVVEVLKNKQENEVDIYSKGSTRRSKYDYLSKWREMYGHGTLEAPEAPTLRFGRTPEDHKETLASSVKAWYGRNKRSPAEAAQIQRWSEEESRTRETHVAESALQRAMRKRGNKKGPKKTSRSE